MSSEPKGGGEGGGRGGRRGGREESPSGESIDAEKLIQNVVKESERDLLPSLIPLLISEWTGGRSGEEEGGGREGELEAGDVNLLSLVCN